MVNQKKLYGTKSLENNSTIKVVLFWILSLILIEIGAKTEIHKSIFFVRDNGVGIKHGQHERMFGLSYKLDTSAEGTGMGLSLVKRIVEAHGRKIWIESDGNGNGSAFYFTLSDSSINKASQ